MPSFYVGGKNILNTKPISPEDNFEGYRVTYFKSSQKPSSISSHPGSVGDASANTNHEVPAPSVIVTTTPSHSSSAQTFTQAADEKWKTYTLHKHKKTYTKKTSGLKQRSIFVYNKSSEGNTHGLQRVKLPKAEPKASLDESVSKKDIQPKLVVFHPEAYKDQNKLWKKKADISLL